MSHALHPTRLQVLNTANGLPLLARWSMSFAVIVTTWDMRHRTRKHLSDLSEHQLRDIGIDRATARIEAAKVFWQG